MPTLQNESKKNENIINVNIGFITVHVWITIGTVIINENINGDKLRNKLRYRH